MLYNIFQKSRVIHNPSWIIGLNESQVHKVVQAYLKGDHEVSVSGRNYQILGGDFMIYTVNAEIGSNKQQIEHYFDKYVNAYCNRNYSEKVFQEHGEDVTDQFLHDQEYGSLKAEEEKIPDNWKIIHPVICNVSQTRFETGHYADAVEAAFKEINNIVKKAYKAVEGHEEDGDKLMRKAFSMNNPIFKFSPNITESDKNIQQGYMDIFAGAIKGIRNPKAHANLDVHPEEAWEMIVMASHLMRMWDKTKTFS